MYQHPNKSQIQSENIIVKQGCNGGHKTVDIAVVCILFSIKNEIISEIVIAHPLLHNITFMLSI